MLTSLATAARPISTSAGRIFSAEGTSSQTKKRLVTPWYNAQDFKTMHGIIKPSTSFEELKPAKELMDRFGIQTIVFKNSDVYVRGRLVQTTDPSFRLFAKKAEKSDKKLNTLWKNINASIKNEGTIKGLLNRKLANLKLQILSSSMLFFPLYCYIYGHPSSSIWSKLSFTEAPIGKTKDELEQAKELIVELENEITIPGKELR